MSICNALTNGVTKSCSNNAGGVNKIYIADYANLTTVATGTASGYTGTWISGLTMTGSTKFYEFQTNKNVCSYDENVAIDLKNGTTFFNQDVKLILSHRDTTKRDAIEKLVAGQKQLVIIVLDSNGNYWLFGQNEGAYVSTITGGSGIAKADANGYSIQFAAMEPSQAYQVDPTIVAAIVA